MVKTKCSRQSRMDTKPSQQSEQLRTTLFDEGYLDEQFIQLEELEDDINPSFVEEIVNSHYFDSVRLIQYIELALAKCPIDFDKLDDYMHQFKGSSSSIGAKKVLHGCSQFREYCAMENGEGCIKTFEMIKQEHSMLRKKLELYFQLKNN